MTDWLTELEALAEEADWDISNPAFAKWAAVAWINRDAILAMGRENAATKNALEMGILSFERDQASNDFQRGYLAALREINRAALEGGNHDRHS